MSDFQPEIAARFGSHLWFRGFKARIGLTTVAEIPLEQPEIEKIYAEEEGLPVCLPHCAKEKAGRFLRERIIPTPELEYLPPVKQAAA
jgi:hypothetical protein